MISLANLPYPPRGISYNSQIYLIPRGGNDIFSKYTLSPVGELLKLAFLSYISHLYLIPHGGNDIFSKFALSPTGGIISLANLPYPTRGEWYLWHICSIPHRGKSIFVRGIKFQAVNQDSAAGNRNLISAVMLTQITRTQRAGATGGKQAVRSTFVDCGTLLIGNCFLVMCCGSDWNGSGRSRLMGNRL